MATSGSFNTPSYMNLSIKFDWSVKSQSETNNSSVIAWSISGDRPSNIIGMLTCGNFTVTIDGNVVYNTGRYDRVDVYNKTVIASGETTIFHNSDGSKTFGVDIQAAIYYGEVNNTGSAEFDLPRIPRASVPTLSASSANFGSKITIFTNRSSSSFVHKLCYLMNGGSETVIAENIATSHTWTIPYELLSAIPDAKSAVITFRLYTYNGGDETGSADVALTANVPSNAETQPDVVINSLIPVSEMPAPLSALFVQNKSKVRASVTNSGKYGASIESCVMNVDGISYDSSSNYTSDYLTGYGEKTVTITVTDSRGISKSVSQKITVVAYATPKINVSRCERCDASGNASDSGTYLKIIAKRTYSKVMSGDTQNNFCLIRYRYKAASADDFSAWTTILAKNSLNADEVETAPLLGGALSVAVTYQVQIQALDDVGEYAETTLPIATEKVYWHRDGERRSFMFGGYVEEDNTFGIAEGIEFVVKSEKWVSLGLSGSVSQASGEDGRTESGCSYRVVNGNHVYVEFNCAVTYSGSAIAVSANALPSKYRPTRNVYSFCVPSGKAIACVSVAPSGYVYIEWIHDTLKTSTSSYSAAWIDGYIDFFV